MPYLEWPLDFSYRLIATRQIQTTYMPSCIITHSSALGNGSYHCADPIEKRHLLKRQPRFCGRALLVEPSAIDDQSTKIGTTDD
jgi:hypothetical protein